MGAAEFLVLVGFHRAAQLFDHDLLAVANAEHRQAKLEQTVGRAGGFDVGDAGGTAGKNHAARVEDIDAFDRHAIEWMDFAVNARFPDLGGRSIA